MSFSTKLFDEMSSVRLDDKSREFSVIVSETLTSTYQYRIDGLTKEQALEAIASQKYCEDLLDSSPATETVSINHSDTDTSLDMVYKDGEPWFADQEK